MQVNGTRWILRFSAIGLWAAALTYLLFNAFYWPGLILAVGTFAYGAAVWLRKVVAVAFLSLLFVAVAFLVPPTRLDPLHAIQSGPSPHVAVVRVGETLSASGIALAIGVILWSAGGAVRRQRAPVPALLGHSWFFDRRVAIVAVVAWTILAVLLTLRYMDTVHSVQRRTNGMLTAERVPPHP